jgi:hypothetical protein
MPKHPNTPLKLPLNIKPMITQLLEKPAEALILQIDLLRRTTQRPCLEDRTEITALIKSRPDSLDHLAFCSCDDEFELADCRVACRGPAQGHHGC